MTTSITTIQSSDLITNSRADINNNFSSLNSNKIETSVIDTDTTLAANSDVKIATQKAVKAYVDSGGNQNASETARGIVEEATDAEVTAGTATGSTGAKLFVTPAKLATRTTAVLADYQPTLITRHGTISRDLTAAGGTVNVAHGLGKAPKRVSLVGLLAQSTGRLITCRGEWDGGGQSSTIAETGDGTTTAVYTSGTYIMAFRDGTGSDPYTNTPQQRATITVDATNIIFSWDKNGSPTGTAQIMWSALA